MGWTELNFTVILPPRGQARSRHRTVTTKAGRTFSTAYKATEQKKDEDKLLALLFEHRPPRPLKGPLRLDIVAYLPIPASYSKKKRDAALSCELMPTVKPDIDNVAKHVIDVMTGVFYDDDKQFVKVLLEKMYGEVPRYEITIGYLVDRQVDGYVTVNPPECPAEHGG